MQLLLHSSCRLAHGDSMSQQARVKRSEKDAADDFDLTNSRLLSLGKQRPVVKKKNKKNTIGLPARVHMCARLSTQSLPQ